VKAATPPTARFIGESIRIIGVARIRWPSLPSFVAPRHDESASGRPRAVEGSGHNSSASVSTKLRQALPREHGF
ncbi:MAG TPA: hypothetical protein VIP05_24045, partial [Burkholderiaceae bacterium]